MRVLLVNKFYHPSGGAERYVFDWERILRAKGHEALVFSMRHPRNRSCPQERFFIEEVRFDKAHGLRDKARAALHSIWSTEAQRRLEQLLDAEGPPDIAHLHGIVYQLTPSIVGVLHRRGIPMVQTCHEYAHVCVNQRLYNQRTDEICEACLKTCALAPLWTRCLKGSFAAAATACAAGLVERIAGRMRSRVARFLAPSDFMRRKMIEGGVPAERVAHVPNFTDVSAVRPSDARGDYVLFVGRLVKHKGILTVLDAAEALPDVPFRIAGEGPLADGARERVAQRNLRNVALVGFLDGEPLHDALRAARVVLAPSEWYENGPLVILEAMATGRAVIAARMGGIPEMVTDGEEGLLVEPRDANGLAAAIRTLWGDPDRASAMGRKGRAKAEAQYDPEKHYERVMGHFREVIG